MYFNVAPDSDTPESPTATGTAFFPTKPSRYLPVRGEVDLMDVKKRFRDAIKYPLVEHLKKDVQSVVSTSPILKSFKVFSMLNLPTEDTLLTDYAQQEVVNLASYCAKPFKALKYNEETGSVEPSIVRTVVDEDDCATEFFHAKKIMRDNYQKPCRMFDAMAQRLSELNMNSEEMDIQRKAAEKSEGMSQRSAYDGFISNYSATFPNLCTLLRIQRVIPTNSSKNERVGSLMTIDKTKRQDRLADDTFLARVNIHENGPATESFDYSTVVNKYFNDDGKPIDCLTTLLSKVEL